MPRALVLDDGSIEVSPTSQKLTAINKSGQPYRVVSVEHPKAGSQVEIGKKVYEVQPGPEEDTILLRLVRVVA